MLQRIVFMTSRALTTAIFIGFVGARHILSKCQSQGEIAAAFRAKQHDGVSEPPFAESPSQAIFRLLLTYDFAELHDANIMGCKIDTRILQMGVIFTTVSSSFQNASISIPIYGSVLIFIKV